MKEGHSQHASQALFPHSTFAIFGSASTILCWESPSILNDLCLLAFETSTNERSLTFKCDLSFSAGLLQKRPCYEQLRFELRGSLQRSLNDVACCSIET
jgi:hypothetical protein